jgi:hypothetical protein
MRKMVMAVLNSHRREAASKVQAVLTGWGCMIKTRLGYIDPVLLPCLHRIPQQGT